MNYRAINHTIGVIILVEMAFMAPSLIWCWIDRDLPAALALFKALAVMAAAAALFLLVGRCYCR